MNFKLGQTFWMRDERSDFECKVVGTKVCEFIDGSKFTDFLVDRTRLNSYHVSFKTKESRTHSESYRYDHGTKELTHWHVQGWPSEFSEWRKVEDKILKTKPKNLRTGP